MDFIKEFGQIGKGDAATAGGKGASLGEMTQADIPVPPGFVILSSAFERFLEETDLHAEIDTVLHTVDQREMHTVENASAKIQALILNAKMPEDIATTIRDFYTRLDTQFVAVRSSATAEDSANAAWAGQLDSFLNTTEETLLTNVQKCWASLFTPRAIFYRYEKELHKQKISVAVVVQKMVQSEVSGIAFSVHPVTEDYNQLIIEAGFGLGEAIVSGSVTPDSYVIEKNPRRIIDKNVTYQSRALWRAENGGNEWRELSQVEGTKPALSDEQALALAEIILRIESHYGFPCDIEWAFEAGTFYITQSRPITTLAPLVSKDKTKFISPELADFPYGDFQFVGLWQSDLFAAYFWTHWYKKEVMEKLDFSLNLSGCLSLKGGHFFYRKEPFQWGIAEVASMIADTTGVRSKKYREHAEEDFKKLLLQADSFIESGPTSENFKKIVEIGEGFMSYWVTSNLLSPNFDTLIAEKAVAEGVPAEDVVGLIPRFPALIDSQHADAKRLLGLLEKKSLDALLATDTDKLAATIRHDDDLKREFEEHLQKYGWLELLNFIGTPLSLERLLDQMKTAANGAQNTQTHHSHAKKLSKDFEHLLHIAADIGFVRQGAAEGASIFHYKLIGFLERTAQALGLEYREMLNLVPQEIIDGLDGVQSREQLKTLVEKRRNYNWLVYSEAGTENLVVVDEKQDVDALQKLMVPTADEHTDTLAGQIGNKGKARAKVSVILATDDFHKFVEGNVLVTTMTTPDFVILMQKSAAIVTDIGGMLSHASIVSRELGKPCVIGTKFATQVLKDGDLVEVDADNGVVRILEKASSRKIVMANTQSREHSLTYFHVWQIANQMRTNGWFENVKNILFVNDGMHKKTRTWYDKKELEDIFVNAGNRAANEKEFFKRVSEEFTSLTDELVPYCERGKKIESAGEWKRFYETWIQWWASMAVVFVLPESATAPESVRERALALRKETEKYSDSGDRVAMDYVRTQYPQYAKLAEVMTPDEILHADSLTPEQEREIANRQKGYVFLNGRLYPREELDSLAAEHNLLLEEAGADLDSEIKGSPASSGKARGSVVVVYGKRDLARVTAESVLVTEMTSPDYVPAMKKAAAIVTDEGGVNCHAAIVARELGKPCVIGTKFATQVLHDGDLVEVDADNGVVRILERAEGTKQEVPDGGDFEFTFESKGTSFIFESLVSEFYDPSGTITISSNATKRVFSSLRTLANMRAEGLAMDEAKLMSDAKKVKETIAQMKKETRGLAAKKDFSREDAEHMLEMLGRFCKEYFAFDVNMWDEVYQLADTDANAAKKASVVEKSKNEIRADVDPVFFDRNGYLSVLLERLSACYGVPVTNLEYYRYQDILDLFEGNRVSESEIARRKQGFVSYKNEGGHITFCSGDDALRFANDFLAKKEVPKQAETIEGKTAYATGKSVRGKVKILVRDYGNAEATRAQMAAMNEGDILVSTTTDPEIIEAMRKAGAIVTDVGGFLSHAAITARELGKPCIVGTQIATQVLHDGDLVEVDADNGVVKILESVTAPDPKDYTRMFAGKSFVYILTDIFLGYYNSLGVLSVQDEESWMSFIPKATQQKTLDAGKELYTSLDLFNKYKEDFGACMRTLTKYFESVIQKDVIDADAVKKFFELASNYFSYYSKTEFFYTDLVDQKEMVLSVKDFDTLKLRGRAYLNKLIFEESGYVRSLISKISKQTKVPEADLLNYSINEMFLLVKNNTRISNDKIKERGKFFASKEVVLFGKDSSKLVTAFLSSYRDISSVIKGTIAHRGRTVGSARVLIPDFKDFSKIAAAVNEMEYGEILVAETTSPEIIQACKKAGAIVTNQGGMLSHAAIISREFGIPCIIGTDKDVVLNIKTGDLVEVDADNGIIKIMADGAYHG